MPILGLFPSAVEKKYKRDVDELTSGKQSSQAVQGIQRDADVGRKEAFAQAYSSRGNAALAQRQAQAANTDITVGAGQTMATQRASDQATYRGEQNRLEAQRQAGIHNAVGFAAQGAALLAGGESQDAKDKREFEEWKRNRDAGGGGGGGGPRSGGQQMADGVAQGGLQGGGQAAGSIAGTAMGGPLGGMLGGMAGGAGVNAATSLFSGGNPAQAPAGQPAPGQQPQSAAGASVQPLVTGQNAPQPTMPSAQGQADVAWATQPQAPQESGMASLYDRPGNQRDPAMDDYWRQQQGYGVTSDERMKNAAANGSAPAAQFLDQLTAAMEGLRQTLPADLQASADKAIQMVQPEGFTGESVENNESKDWDRGAEVFDNVEPQSFEYTAEGRQAGGAPGPQLGVMAQDVEQIAPGMVNEDPAGVKHIDVNQGLSAVMGAQAELNRRIRRLEGDPLADLDSESADPLDNLRDTERPDLYSRPGNQRSASADRPQRTADPEEARYQRHHRFLTALDSEFEQGRTEGTAARNARRRSGVRL